MRIMLTEPSASVVTVVLDSGNRVVIQPDGDITVVNGDWTSYSFQLPTVNEVAAKCSDQGETGVITNGIVIYHKH